MGIPENVRTLTEKVLLLPGKTRPIKRRRLRILSSDSEDEEADPSPSTSSEDEAEEKERFGLNGSPRSKVYKIPKTEYRPRMDTSANSKFQTELAPFEKF
jgi:hypothetical protein